MKKREELAETGREERKRTIKRRKSERAQS
jgi:hypothetical protein